MMGQGFDRFSAWFLVLFGTLLLVLGAFGLAIALVNHEWPEALFTLALLVVVALGTRRGLRQLNRPGPASPP
jgi:hypothetical protein